MGYCTYGWAFARGTDMSDTVVLTVAPKTEGSLYSVALELIMAPPRPTGSFVPAAATQVTVRTGDVLERVAKCDLHSACGDRAPA